MPLSVHVEHSDRPTTRGSPTSYENSAEVRISAALMQSTQMLCLFTKLGFWLIGGLLRTRIASNENREYDHSLPTRRHSTNFHMVMISTLGSEADPESRGSTSGRLQLPTGGPYTAHNLWRHDSTEKTRREGVFDVLWQSKY